MPDHSSKPVPDGVLWGGGISAGQSEGGKVECAASGARRVACTDLALAEGRRCMDEGIDVKSDLDGALPDNFEWTRGQAESVGRIVVDRTFARSGQI